LGKSKKKIGQVIQAVYCTNCTGNHSAGYAGGKALTMPAPLVGKMTSNSAVRSAMRSLGWRHKISSAMTHETSAWTSRVPTKYPA